MSYIHNKPIVSLESSHGPECICFFLNATSSIVNIVVLYLEFYSRGQNNFMFNKALPYFKHAL